MKINRLWFNLSCMVVSIIDLYDVHDEVLYKYGRNLKENWCKFIFFLVFPASNSRLIVL